MSREGSREHDHNGEGESSDSHTVRIVPQTGRMIGHPVERINDLESIENGVPMRLLRMIVLVVAFAVVVRAQPVAVAPDSLGVPELLAQFKVPAVSVAVIRDFKIEWARAWGVKRRQDR